MLPNLGGLEDPSCRARFKTCKVEDQGCELLVDTRSDIPVLKVTKPISLK